MKRTPLKRKNALKAKGSWQNKQNHIKPKKKRNRRHFASKNILPMLDSMPYYSKITRKRRYADPVKDRAWSILSDYVRIRDFIKYGTCISTGKKINHWSEVDAGHYENMGSCGASCGFYDMNVHAQSKIDNKLSSMASGARYRDELIKRYGPNIITKIDRRKKETVKADNIFFIKKIQEIYKKFLDLKKQFPDFDYPIYL